MKYPCTVDINQPIDKTVELWSNENNFKEWQDGFIGQNKTQYISEVEYTKFNGFIIKLMAKLFPNKFKAQSQKWMNQFKKFTKKSR